MREMGVILLLILMGPGGAGSTFAADEGQGQAQQREPRQEKQDYKPAPKSPQPKTARPVPASSPQPAPLRFTDFDLEKYHAPAPAEEEDSEGEEESPATVLEDAPGSPTTGARATPPRRASPRRPPKPSLALPAADPLKPFHDREALEKFRADQLQRARDRVDGIQSRLDYLKVKRDAVQNPAPLLVGQTRGNNEPGKPPPPPTPIQGPGRGLTATPGTGKVPIMGIFPNLPPPQTEQDKENDKKMKTRDLLALVEEEIKGLDAELEQAQSELVAIQTRFSPDSQSP